MDSPCVLITRPQPAGEQLKSYLEKNSITCVLLPTIEIHAVAYPPITIKKSDYLIFTSVNAVTHYHSDFSHHVFAIGPATQQALADKNIKATTANHYSSEALLTLTALTKLEQKQVLIVTGEQSKDLLAKTLSARGARVTTVCCYKRLKPHYNVLQLQTIARQTFSRIICTSNACLNNLYAIFSAQRQWLLAQPLLVITAKMAQHACQLGFRQPVLIAKNATAEAILEQLKTNHGSHFR